MYTQLVGGRGEREEGRRDRETPICWSSGEERKVSISRVQEAELRAGRIPHTSEGQQSIAARITK